MKKQRLKPYFLTLAQDYSPNNDPWGYAMSAAFDIGAACHLRGVPDSGLGFTPGWGRVTIEDPWNKKSLMRIKPEKLERIARYTDRVIRMLQRAGVDY